MSSYRVYTARSISLKMKTGFRPSKASLRFSEQNYHLKTTKSTSKLNNLTAEKFKFENLLATFIKFETCLRAKPD